VSQRMGCHQLRVHKVGDRPFEKPSYPTDGHAAVRSAQPPPPPSGCTMWLLAAAAVRATRTGS